MNNSQSIFEPVNIPAHADQSEKLFAEGWNACLKAIAADRAKRDPVAAGLSDSAILEAVAAACGHGRVALTHVNNEGVTVPTDVAKCFARALSSRLIPEGWVAVPRKYTENQMMAGYGVACRYGVYEAKAFNLAEDMHKAMIATAPMPKEG